MSNDPRNVVPASRLRVGDRLEPDGTVILATKDEGGGVLVTLKQPARLPVEYWLPRGWLLKLKGGAADE